MMLASVRRRIALALCPELARAPVRPVADLPLAFDPVSVVVWDGRPPRWWFEPELRRLLTASHRRRTLAETARDAAARFPDLAPSRSALARYWARLDTQLGCPAALFAPDHHAQRDTDV